MLIATRSGKINISKEKDTKLVAEKLCKLINVGDLILLTGNLGVGKTTFIKYTINFLQRINRQKISEVPSPTFNITNEYQIKKISIKHYDLYRIKNQKELNTKTDIGWGHQIRSYILQPYQLVKDLRNKVESTNPLSILDGNIDIFIEEGIKNKK